MINVSGMLNDCLYYVLNHPKAPKTTYKTPVEQDIISRLKEENRRKAEVKTLIWMFITL